jgi:hypothetical protein
MLSPKSLLFDFEQTQTRAYSRVLASVGSIASVAPTLEAIDRDVDLILARLGEDPRLLELLSSPGGRARAMVALPKTDPIAMVRLLGKGASAVVVEEYLDPQLLSYMASKFLFGDVFGVSKLLPWGVRVHSELIRTHEERSQALVAVSQLAKSLGLRSTHLEPIEAVLDELIMNALYNAPVDGEGQQVLTDVAPKDRKNLRVENPVLLQVGCDSTRFVLGVRDSFGSLRAETIQGYLERGFESKGPIERKTSGAGLGLYLVASNLSDLVFNLLPGTATEVVGVFDLKMPRQQLRHIGIYEEVAARASKERAGELPRPEAGRVFARSAPSRPAASGGKLVPAFLAAGVLLLAVSTLLLLFGLGSGKRGGHGTLEITAQPSGSTVYLDGIQRGVASPRLVVADLEAGAPHSVSVRAAGYGEAKEVVTVEKDQVVKLSLVLLAGKASLRVTSTPNGATLFVDGKPTGQKTPALLEGLEAGRAVQLRLERFGFLDLVESATPSATEALVHQGTLTLAPSFALLRLDSTPRGARFLVNDADTGLLTPVEAHVLRAGETVRLGLVLKGYAPAEETVVPKEKEQVQVAEVLARGEPFELTTNVKGRVSIDDGPDLPLPLPPRVLKLGTHKVRLHGQAPYVEHLFTVDVAEGRVTKKQVLFGIVVAKKGFRLAVGRSEAGSIALLPGTHELTLQNRKTGEAAKRKVDVVAGATQTLE